MNQLRKKGGLSPAFYVSTAFAVFAGACSDDRRVEKKQEVRTPAAEMEVRQEVERSSLTAPGVTNEQPGALPPVSACGEESAAAVFPGENWDSAYDAAEGWSEERLRQAWQRAQRGSYAAGMLVYRGRVIGRFGDLSKPYEASSIRKNLLNVLVGQLVAKNRLSLSSSLGDLGIEEQPPLNETERSATLRDLLMSRSGIYRPSAYTPPGTESRRPKLGQHKPGQHFWYNNWDFNVLGTIVERVGGKSVFELFQESVAQPIGIQDYSVHDMRYVKDERSLHPAYVFKLSTRDRARLGLLYLRNGCWAGRQIVPADWVQVSTAPLTNRQDELDYGYLWWSQDPIESQGLTERIFMARGFPNQYITCFPELDAVLVLTADRNYPGWINWIRSRLGMAPEFEDYLETRNLVLSARPQARPAQ
jgi:CubicO group peptidase (beta-lactamase class C family)